VFAIHYPNNFYALNHAASYQNSCRKTNPKFKIQGKISLKSQYLSRFCNLPKTVIFIPSGNHVSNKTKVLPVCKRSLHFVSREHQPKRRLLTLRREGSSSNNLSSYFMRTNVKGGSRTWLTVKWSLVTYLTVEPWKTFSPTWLFVRRGSLVKVLPSARNAKNIVVWSTRNFYISTIFYILGAEILTLYNNIILYKNSTT
jgi:hypothetical protein